MKVGITGSTGFVGQHMRWYFYQYRNTIEVIEINRQLLNERYGELSAILKKCDVVIHLASAHPGNTKEADKIYSTNIELARKLVNACDSAKATPYLIFASSTQISRDNPYGRSKKDVMALFREWGRKTGAKVTNLIIPNEFGEYGKPFHSSVVSTFCHQLVRNETSEINKEAVISLIYTQDVAAFVYKLIKNPQDGDTELPGNPMKVGDVYQTLLRFKEEYFNNIVPELKNHIEIALFSTLRSHLVDIFYPRTIEIKTDERGNLFEIARERTGGQTFFSVTKPGYTRGEHYHTRKLERFCVIKGVAEIKWRKLLSDDIRVFTVTGDNPVYIDMPPFYTHNITNVGTTDLLTTFWVNEIYDPIDPDTFFEKV